MNIQQPQTIKDNTLVPRITAAIFAIILFASIFMPFTSATSKYKKTLRYIPDEITQMEFDLDSDDLIDVSMVEYAKIYGENGEEIFDDEFIGFIYVGIVGLVALFSLLCFVSALCKKPFLMIFLNILITLALGLLCFDFVDRNVAPSIYYDFGYGLYVSATCVVLIYIFAIWLFIGKRMNKKAALQFQPVTTPNYPVQFQQPVEAPVYNTWQCACGNIVNGNFCANCGSPKQTVPATWMCGCGTLNNGNFCSKCGNRNESTPQY